MVRTRRWWLIAALVLALVAALAVLIVVFIGNGDEEPAGEATPIAVASPRPTSPGEAGTPNPTDTPFAPPPELLFEQAVDVARRDLAGRLNLQVEQIEVLEPDSALEEGRPQECPALPEAELETITLYYVYLQFERFIYPYQVYQPQEPDADIVVQACADVLVDPEVLFVPTPDARADLMDRVKADLTARGVEVAQGQFVTINPITWTDDALGCPSGPDIEPQPDLIEGYLLIFAVGDTQYEYHADATGERLVFCAPPPGYDSIDALLTAWSENEDLEVIRVEDETATYNGLDREGTLVELTDRGFRVGLFNYESPDAARAAALQIDDPRVARIFVAGSVLLVQEDNSALVFSILQKYAEQVRAPVEERSE